MDHTAFIALLLSTPVHGFYVNLQGGRATLPVAFPHRWHQLWRHQIMDDTLSSIFEENDIDGLDFDESLDLLGVDDVLEMLLLEDSFQGDNLSSSDTVSFEKDPKEQNLDNGDVVEMVLRLLDGTNPGEMDVKEIGLLRNVMQELAANEQEPYSSETARKIEKALLRMLDEYDSAKRTNDAKRMKVAEPRAEDFAMVCIRITASLSHPDVQFTHLIPGNASLVRY